MPARFFRLLCTAASAASLALLPAVVQADECTCDGSAQECTAQCTVAMGNCTAAADGDYAQCVLTPGCGGAEDPSCQTTCAAETQSHNQTCADTYGVCAGDCQTLAAECAQQCATP